MDEIFEKIRTVEKTDPDIRKKEDLENLEKTSTSILAENAEINQK